MKHLIIFNLYDHESLTAASLLKLAFKEAFPYELYEIVDIRDKITEADHYIIVGCGDVDEITSYYSTLLTKSEIKEVIKRSFIFAHDAGDEGIMGTLHYKTGKYFSELQGEDDIGPTWKKITAWALSAANYHTLAISSDGLRHYESMIISCYNAYVTGCSTIEENIPGNPNEIRLEAMGNYSAALRRRSKYATSSREMTLVASRKTREFYNGMMDYTLVSDTSPCLYNLLRRLSLSKRSWFHSTIGLYKEVLFTNEKHPRFRIEEKVHLIELP